jgi:hypothetical protein
VHQILACKLSMRIDAKYWRALEEIRTSGPQLDALAHLEGLPVQHFEDQTFVYVAKTPTTKWGVPV